MRRPSSPARGAVRAVAAVVAVVAVAILGSGTPAGAHPLGNFTTNTALALTVRPTAIDVGLIVDMAEIPALQAIQRLDVNKDKTSSRDEALDYRTSTCQRMVDDIILDVDGEIAPLAVGVTRLTFPPGQAGLSTLRLECQYLVATSVEDETTISVRSNAFSDRVGWREITVAGDGMTVAESDVASVSPSDRLTAYPSAKLEAPLRQERASATLVVGGPRLGAVSGRSVSSPLPRGLDAPTRAFTSFVGRQDLGIGVGAAALALSLVLGAIHALAPGHGKTVMAAYLVGQKGSPRQAAVLGLTVTATHTLGVLVLGLAIAASKVIAPERLYPYLGIVSGLLLAGIGLNLLRNGRKARRSTRAEAAHRHEHDDHGHGHDHEHADHDHEDTGHAHGGAFHRHAPITPGQPLTWSSLLALGFVGGFLPSPSAVVVLLGAITLGRAWFGVLLVIAYGLGMAATLMAAGLLLVRARGALERRLHRVLDRKGNRLLTTLLPVGTAMTIVVVGLALATSAATRLGG